MPQLEAELRQKKFGDRKQKFYYTDFENRYEPGALKTTFALLTREFGVKADRNDDGLISNQDEADLMPCELLKAIEERWRKATKNACGWYSQLRPGRYEVYDAPGCSQLQKQTLTNLIFDPPYDFAVERLNVCKLAPKPLNPNP